VWITFSVRLVALANIRRDSQDSRMRTIWKPVLGYEDFYVVSDTGLAVRTANQGPKARKTWKPVRPHPMNTGYVRFCFCVGNRRDFRFAHRAVWEAFNGPIPEGLTINHLNGVKTDNRVENLEVCTPSENSKHAYRVLGVPAANNPSYGSKNGRAKLKEADIPRIIALNKNGTTQREIAKRYGVSRAMVSFIVTGKYWRHISAAS